MFRQSPYNIWMIFARVCFMPRLTAPQRPDTWPRPTCGRNARDEPTRTKQNGLSLSKPISVVVRKRPRRGTRNLHETGTYCPGRTFVVYHYWSAKKSHFNGLTGSPGYTAGDLSRPDMVRNTRVTWTHVQ